MFFGELLRKKSLGEIFFKNGLWPEINHRILDGIYTDFIELLRKKSLGEIFFKMLLRKKYIQLPGN